MKNLPAIAVIALLMISTAASAADKAPAATSDANGVQQKFGVVESKRLQHIEAALTKLQKAQSCVQASTDFNSLEGCDSPRYKSYHQHHAAKGDAAAGDSDR